MHGRFAILHLHLQVHKLMADLHLHDISSLQDIHTSGSDDQTGRNSLSVSSHPQEFGDSKSCLVEKSLPYTRAP